MRPVQARFSARVYRALRAQAVREDVTLSEIMQRAAELVLGRCPYCGEPRKVKVG